MSKPTPNRLLYVFLAVGALFPVVAAVAAWSFLRTDTGGFVSEMARLALRQMGAPGVAELRRIGCEQAAVFTMGEMFETSLFSDEDRATLARSAGEDQPVVLCMDLYGRRPTCGEVATTYAPFAPDHDALVRVTSRGENVCDGLTHRMASSSRRRRGTRSWVSSNRAARKPERRRPSRARARGGRSAASGMRRRRPACRSRSSRPSGPRRRGLAAQRSRRRRRRSECRAS